MLIAPEELKRMVGISYLQRSTALFGLKHKNTKLHKTTKIMALSSIVGNNTNCGSKAT